MLANFYLARGMVSVARERLKQSGPLSSTKDRAALHGLKAAVFMRYHAEGCERAVEEAKEAIRLDPDQAEWWSILGYALGSLRIFSNEVAVSTDEIEAIEKAVSLQKNAHYVFQLARVYSGKCAELISKWKIEEARTLADKSASKFKEALSMQDSVSMKMRVSHGMVRIKCKEVIDKPFVKNLLEEVLESSPENVQAYNDLAMYYSLVETDIEKAISNYQKAFEIGCGKSIVFLSSLKWKRGREDEIAADLEEGLSRLEGEGDRALLYVYLGVYHTLASQDWESAVLCFQKALDLDPSATHLERFRGFDGKFVNLLELITNHLHFNETEDSQDAVKAFLASVAQKKPQNINIKNINRFMIWKRDIERQKCRISTFKKMGVDTKKVKPSGDADADACVNANQGPLETLSMQIAELIRSVNSLTTKEEVEHIVADVAEIREGMNVVNEKVATLEPRVSDAEVRLEQVEVKVDRIEKCTSDYLDVEELMAEVNDRMRRASNVILHNLPENVKDPVEKRILNDKDLVLKVSQVIEYSFQTTDITVRRIGKPMTGKRRPLIVTFKNANEAKLFLNNLSIDLVKASDPDLADFGVSRDKTERERKYLSSLREELENRNSLGEKGFTLEYKNGVPKIVSKD